MQRFSMIDAGDPPLIAENTQIYVRQTSDPVSGEVQLYQDDEVTPIVQPVLVDANGEAAFKAANGEAWVHIAGQTPFPFRFDDPDDYPAQTAGETPFTPAGNIAATDVQGAIEELDTEKEAAGAAAAVQGNLDTHAVDASHITGQERTDWNDAKTHADSPHEAVGAGAAAVTTHETTHDHTKLPTADEKASFPAGASGADPLVKNSDPRLSDARTPTGHVASHILGGSAPITLAHIVSIIRNSVPNHPFLVVGGSSDGGTTPDATTQAGIDAWLAAGVPQEYILWIYQPAGTVFQGRGLAAGSPVLDRANLSLLSSTFQGRNLATGQPVLDQVNLTLMSGQFLGRDLSLGASLLERVNITQGGGGAFSGRDLALGSPVIDRSSLILASGVLEGRDLSTGLITVERASMLLAGGTFSVRDLFLVTPIIDRANMTEQAGTPDPETVYANSNDGWLNSADGLLNWTNTRNGTGNYGVSLNADGGGTNTDVIKVTIGNSDDSVIYMNRGYLRFTIPTTGTISTAQLKLNATALGANGSQIQVHRVASFGTLDTGDWALTPDTQLVGATTITSGANTLNISAAGIAWMNANQGSDMYVWIRESAKDIGASNPTINQEFGATFTSTEAGNTATDPQIYFTYE